MHFLINYVVNFRPIAAKRYDLPPHRLQAFMQLVVIQSLHPESEHNPSSFQVLQPEPAALIQTSFEKILIMISCRYSKSS